MEKSLKKGILSVFIANIINLLFNLTTNIVIPKFLSVDSYASIKTFQLYTMYAGVLALGYVDGMYLKYGGVYFENIDKNKLHLSSSTLRIFQVAITAILIIISIFLRDSILLAASIAILPLNMSGYFNLLYQAMGEFSKYGKILNATTILIFIINISLIFIYRTDSFMFYLIAYVIVYIIVWIILEVYMCFCCKVKFNILKFSFPELRNNIKLGFLLMCGNFSSSLLSSMDRWFVKVLLDSVAFAQYSFAISIEGFLNIAVTPVIVTLYNFFCRKNDNITIKRTLNCVIIFAVIIISAAFPAKYVLETYLTNYIGSVQVLFYAFAAQIFYIVIKGIYINLYKAKNMQRVYFGKLIFVIIVGLILNTILIHFYKQKESLAIGTLLSAITWLIISICDFKEIKYRPIEIIYIFAETIVFLGCGLLCSTILGFSIYILITIILTMGVFKNDFLFMLQNILSVLISKIKQ